MHNINRRTIIGGIATGTAMVGAGQAFAVSGSTVAGEASRAPVAVSGASPAMRAKIAAHRKAMTAYLETINPSDTVWCRENGVPCTKANQRRRDRASDEEMTALARLCRFPGHTPADRRAKANYLLKHVGARTLQPEDVEALLRAMREEGRAAI